MILEGSAFMDRSGQLVVADAEFKRLLGLPPGDVKAAFRARVAADPCLASFLESEGPSSMSREARDSALPYRLDKIACDSGVLLEISSCPAHGALEQVLQAVIWTSLAGSLAHDVKNPLNAMALQVALLHDKIDNERAVLAAPYGGNFASLRAQIDRIDGVVKRQLEMLDPAPGTSFEIGSLIDDSVGLLAHEARRRRIALDCRSSRGLARIQGDPVRAARLVLAAVWWVVTCTPEGGGLVCHVDERAQEVTIGLERSVARVNPEADWVEEVLRESMREMGWRFETTIQEGNMRAAITLPEGNIE